MLQCVVAEVAHEEHAIRCQCRRRHSPQLGRVCVQHTCGSTKGNVQTSLAAAWSHSSGTSSRRWHRSRMKRVTDHLGCANHTPVLKQGISAHACLGVSFLALQCSSCCPACCLSIQEGSSLGDQAGLRTGARIDECSSSQLKGASIMAAMAQKQLPLCTLPGQASIYHMYLWTR